MSMTSGQWVILIYAALVLAGGIMGYRAGSKASLAASGMITALLGAALALSSYRMEYGLWFAVVLALAVCGMMGQRYAATKKFMPAGMTLGLSLVVVALLLLEIF